LAGTNDTTSTGSAWGPFMVTDQDILVHELYYNVLYVVVNGGLWFAFVLMAAWWMESSKKRMEQLQKRKAQEKALAESKDKFVCSECGADVPGDAKECPQCGEKFDD
ncbi:MAG: zinc-ribbon domain-containing protein, partial [Methanomassiliicoccales archaeon]|nr:zinc-ribbon domain-containing protein [Methanomassiliicoccales archaeon]